MTDCNFGPAAETESIVYGACRPGYNAESTTTDAVKEWIQVMQANGIERVCCLLDAELENYENLLDQYEQAFGSGKVCHAAIPDYDVVSSELFHNRILPFLEAADNRREPVVVHCSAGSGRTGHILVLWLVHRRGYSLQEAIVAVERQNRRPLEAASRADLEQLC
ncbi:MAG: dual specificity protein phosphatase family protein [Halobacteriaceae archaeon]